MAATQPVVKTIAVIGAGPSGIAAAKYLVSERTFSKLTVFEQRSNAGGIWNTDSRSSPADSMAFPSPIYHDMESNIPSEIMQYCNRPFPDSDPLLPDAGLVLEYLRDYASEVLPHVHMRFGHRVVAVTPAVTNECTHWTMVVEDVNTGSIIRESYDAVVVANGRYNKPYMPDVHGLDNWKQSYPDSVMHSKFYRDAKMFKDKKVVIVGFSSSGVDIANAIEPVCSKPLLISQNSTNGLSPGSKGFQEGKTMLPGIIEFDSRRKAIRFADGREETEVDYIIFCTGYDYDYPFLSSLPGFEKGNGDGNIRTYQHIFHVDYPTLAFIMLPLRAVAFPFAETQSAVVARVWSGRLQLPVHREMQNWIEKNMQERGRGKRFHMLSWPADAEYMNAMYSWCQQARAEKCGGYLAPPFWGEKEKWLRRTLHEIRRATEAQGEARFLIKTVAQAGFHFSEEEHKVDAAMVTPPSWIKDE
ncbi:hypothetical protein L204_100011 [Cryptococcus depauperatus]|nr:hypothetical protein L204_02510 [Cryptococcus depauperatus CBS 7855]